MALFKDTNGYLKDLPRCEFRDNFLFRDREDLDNNKVRIVDL